MNTSTDRTPPLTFWFVRPLRRWISPDWLAAVVFIGLIQAVLAAVDVWVGGSQPWSIVYFSLFALFLAWAAVVVGQETDRVLVYAEAMGVVGTDAHRAQLYRVRWSLLIYLALAASFLVPWALAPGTTALVILGSGFPEEAGLTMLMGASLFWAFGSSMFTLYQLGRAPLRLTPFTEDPALGLNRYGGAALRLVGVYELAILFIALPVVIQDAYGPGGIPYYVGLALLGLALFFVSLTSFRHLLREARDRELGWITPRCTELVRAIRDRGAATMDPALGGTLAALKEIQRDAERIPSWPIDLSTATRLASITVLPMIITVVARELVLLTLHV